MTDVQKVPALRFPEFTVDLTLRRLGALATFSKGRGISKSDIEEDGAMPCVRYGELYTTYGEVIDEVFSRTNLDPETLVISEPGDVIVPASGETQIDIATASCVLRGGIALSGDLNIIRSSINGVFLAYYLGSAKKYEIASMAQGNSVVHLYAKQLKTLLLNLPASPEQQKIATFLAAVDERLRILEAQREELLDYKQGVMQRIFDRELRFKDEDGEAFPEWEEKRLGDIGKYTGGGTPSSSVDKYWEGDIPWISSSDLTEASTTEINISRFITEEAISNSATKLITKGSVLIVSRVGIGKFAVAPSDLCTSQDFTNLTTDQNSYFLAELFSFRKSRFVRMGQGTSIKGFTVSDIKGTKFYLPVRNEQDAIMKYLSLFDRQLEGQSKRIDNLAIWKIGLLQSLFI